MGAGLELRSSCLFGKRLSSCTVSPRSLCSLYLEAVPCVLSSVSRSHASHAVFLPGFNASDQWGWKSSTSSRKPPLVPGLYATRFILCLQTFPHCRPSSLMYSSCSFLSPRSRLTSDVHDYGGCSTFQTQCGHPHRVWRPQAQLSMSRTNELRALNALALKACDVQSASQRYF